MKAYTLRINEQLLMTMKQIGLKENMTLKKFILEAIEEKISKYATKTEDFKHKKMFERAARLASRLTTEQVVASIREDRER